MPVGRAEELCVVSPSLPSLGILFVTLPAAFHLKTACLDPSRRRKLHVSIVACCCRCFSMINGGCCGTGHRQLARNSGQDAARQPKPFLHLLILKLHSNKTAQRAKNGTYLCAFSFPVIKTVGLYCHLHHSCPKSPLKKRVQSCNV